MRNLLLGTLVVLLWGSTGLAGEEEARAIIAKAVKAHGGAEHLARLKAVRVRAGGSITANKAGVEFTYQTVWQSPGRLRNVLQMPVGNQKLTVIQILDGDRGWASVNGLTTPLDEKRLGEMKAQAHVRRLLPLTPLLEDKAYRLTALDETTVNDRPALGVKVAAKGQRDVRLYFDKETGLLVKVERQALDEGTMKEVRQEQFLSDFGDRDGLKTERKQVWHRDGKKVLEMTFTEIKYPEKIDAAEFADPSPFTRTEDVIYGRKAGTALTLDVLTPKKDANGAAVIWVVSGGWFSSHDQIPALAGFAGIFTLRGYTVFLVVHGSQPTFTIPEAIADLNRAVRFIRHHARDYRIDPDRIGIGGASAGGHLSLMQGTAGDLGDPKSTDPVERVSSRVQAVACFFPPTDFVNYGGPDKFAFAPDGLLANYRTAFDVRELDPKTKRLEHLTDEKKVLDLARRISPLTHVSADDAPTLIIHGDADKLVPISQAEAIVARFKEVGVPVELVVKKGADHGWPGLDKDVATCADWFDKHLKKK
jgi:acetyl esterase/lipase